MLQTRGRGEGARSTRENVTLMPWGQAAGRRPEPRSYKSVLANDHRQQPQR